MALQLTARWLADGQPLDTRLIALLRAVARTGSLNQAVTTLRMSYRHAWGLLGRTERSLGQPLVVLRRGRGAQLSPLGERLLAADDAATDVLNRELAEILRTLNQQEAARPATRPVVMHASHDFALAGLRDLLSKENGAGFELSFRGSLDSLADLARGDCDIAGFHVPDAAAGAGAFEPYRPWLKARSLRLVRFVTRRQGIMVARGNRNRIQSLADLTQAGVRFINRQPGSGTRLYFDFLLAAARIPPSRINGYQVEEFTHAAVAATVASGMADAGFGIEAAASQQGLDFIALATERYFLAARASALAGAALRSLIETLQSAAFRKYLDGLAGYDAPGIGEILLPRQVLRAV
jgi:putative molybdopterin biosynthesis protein